MKIAIASGKGGTGKTTLAVNLAMFLSENANITLADLDVEEPNSGLFISGELINSEDKYKMIPVWERERCTFCGKCQEVCNFQSIFNLGSKIMVFPKLCHSCYACSELCPESALPMKPDKMGHLNHFKIGNLTFVESRLDVGQEQAVPLIAQTLEYVQEISDGSEFIFLDSPPGTSCPVIEVIKNVDFIILVTEPTPFGLHDLKLAVETAKPLNKAFGVVINRYGIGNDDVLKYCDMENIQVLAKIPNNRKVAELYSHGKLIFTEVEDFRHQLELIYQQLTEINLQEIE